VDLALVPGMDSASVPPVVEVLLLFFVLSCFMALKNYGRVVTCVFFGGMEAGVEICQIFEVRSNI
jgi:hypothetical protein